MSKSIGVEITIRTKGVSIFCRFWNVQYPFETHVMAISKQQHLNLTLTCLLGLTLKIKM